MLVNPQFFNYRLIIGSLLIAIVFLGAFSFKMNTSNKADQQFLEREKKLIEGELSQMMSSYDALNMDSQSLTASLDHAKRNTQIVLTKLSLLTSDISVISRFKTELSQQKLKHSHLFKTVDSMKIIIQNLENEKSFAYHSLDDQKIANHSLLKINANLTSTIERGALLKVNSLVAKAYKSNSNASETQKASNTNHIEVCFKLVENTLTKKGTKDIYIQILNPLNNVVAKKGADKFGEFLLIYSDKQHINYNNKNINVCSTIQTKQPLHSFTKGTYYVSVFHEDRMLGATQIVLN